ncbi:MULTISPECIES: fimbrial protein [unclassified Pseudomonas]|uniref:fimbrial protein n=1 Tax=unclassified Pseudomonas TaxID=196821 RepID=UPI000BD58842|nr:MULTISPECIES: fimbrial protein [unclassified Pseudomonas]PVZ12668.1 hypothetical protein F474_03474 [Pseudomonas sp. URIL14HWK12:I12]PVZ23181.1 hypothetical protein F470_02729 [Pseudomonas sp. URIL14HWK12:I10]PVZ32510.1 hypothetical protein F472_03076 [Pseudomonas sp. URIL14HWK12:I11]SNZ13568.1 hypothetical protein SAMN05660463_02425 [Pseudomonas sp. URIL14HWK12:I9]
MNIFRWPLTIPGLLCLSLCWALAGYSKPAYAFISGSMVCGTSVPDYNYTFEPGAAFRIPFSGNCTAIRVFPFGAAANLSIQPTSGTAPAEIRVLDTYSNTYMSKFGLGTAGAACLGGGKAGPCPFIPVNGRVDYTYYLVGTAPYSPGTRTATVRLGITAVRYPDYAEWLHTFTFRYTVASTACTLLSPSSLNLNFGTISSATLSNQVQRVAVSVNCPTQKMADVYLIPTQQTVNTSGGVAKTTLDGLNMQALWGDTNAPINFSTARRLLLGTGINSVALAFKPQLAGGQTPSGAFQSGYTLVINYL